MSKGVLSQKFKGRRDRGLQARALSVAAREAILGRCVLEMLENRQLLSVNIPLYNGDFESPTWVKSGTNWVQQAVAPGTQALNYNETDPRFGPPGYGKTAEGGGGPGPNGEGLYNEHNDLGVNQYFTYVNGQLPAPANGTNFFCLIPAPGGTYHVWVDQQPDTTGDTGNHGDLAYPPLIPATTAHVGKTYQLTVALGNPLTNASNPSFPNIEVDLTIGAATYNMPSHTDSRTTPAQAGDTWLYYDGAGTNVATATTNDPNWVTPGNFRDISLTWTCPPEDDGLPLGIMFVFAGMTKTVAMDNIRLVDITTPPAAPSAVIAAGASTSQINLNWTDNSNNESGFKIDQSTSADFSTGVSTATVGANVNYYTATGLSASTTYYYRVRATNSSGDSANTAMASAKTGVAGTPIAVTVPDGDFTDVAGYYINSNTGGDLTFTQPMTGALSGWSLSAKPTTANGGYYSWGGWEPFGAVDSVTSGSGDSPVSNNAPWLGSQPGSSYHAFMYYPGEVYPSTGVVKGAQPGASLTMTTTGINQTAVVGSTYTASIQYGNVSWTNIPNPSANVALNILANGVVVSSSHLSGLAPGTAWTPVTVGWVADAAHAGQAIQIQAVATNFLEGPGQWQVPSFGFAHTTLSVTTPSGALPPAPTGLTATAASSSQINLSWTDNSSNETGFKIDQATSSDFSTGLTTAAVGANVTTYSATGLSSGTTYYYRVRSSNASGDSANTSTASATTQSSVPAAPSGLTAAAISSSQINLSWTDNSSSETGFKIDRATSSDFSTGLTTVTVGAGVTTYNATGLTAGITYYYRVRATNASGDSANTSTASATTTAGVTTPITVPDGSFEQATVGDGYQNPTSGAYPDLSIALGGTPQNAGNFGIKNSSGSQSISSPGAGPAAQNGSSFLSMWPGETPYLDNGNGISTVIDSTLTVTTTGINAIAVAGTTYTAAVAVTLPGYSWSTAKPSSYFGLPDGVIVSPAYRISILANGTVVATQTLPMNSIGAVNVWQDVATSWTAPANLAGTSLQVKVEAYNFTQGPYHAYTPQAAIDNIRLSYASASTAVPAAPTNLTATAASSSQINLSWSDNSGTGFKIDRATSSDFSTGLTTVTVAAGATTYNATGLSAAATYYFRVRATNSAGDSANTSTASATTAQATGPAAPLSATATAVSSSQINLVWFDNSTNETGFKVDQATDSGFTQNLTTFTVGADVKTYSVTGLFASTTYYYRVRSTNAGGDSANSPIGSAITLRTGTALIVTNPTFDDQNLICGDGDDRNAEHQNSPYPDLSHDAWFGTATGVPNGVTPWWGRWNPTNAQFPGTSDTLLMSGPPGYNYPYIVRPYLPAPASGVQYAFVTPYTDGGTGPLSTVWTVNSERFCVKNPDYSTATVTAGKYYVASMAVGCPLDTGCPDYTIQLVTEDTTTGAILQVLSSTKVSRNSIAPGTFYDLTTTYTAPASGGPIGGMLAIAIVCDNFYETNGVGTVGVFSNARVTVSDPILTPNAPSNLTATASSTSQIDLNWTDNSSDETGFKIDQATDSNFTQNLTTFAVGANVTSYSATGLTSAVTYYYRVRATNSHGDSANTFTSSVTTQGVTPAVPSGLTANAASSSQINLGWTDNSSNETGFRIDQATSADFSTGLTTVSVGANVTSYSATGLSSGTTYYFRVRATNGIGDSANSATASATTQATAPAAPSGLTATAASSSQINLSWTDNSSNETGFKIDQATSADFTQGLITTTVAAGVTSYSASGLASLTTYYYRVRATNAVGDSANTSTATAMTAPVGTPVAITVPDADFTDAAGDRINSNTGGGLTFTSPITATLAGWTITANPSTAGGGYYSGWEPYGVLDAVTGGGSASASPYNCNAPWLGNQPASSYHAFVYYPGELYNWNNVVGGAQPGASLTMTTTGISAAAVTGNTYTATIQYANVSWSNCSANPSANVALNIVANGVVVGTGTLAGLAQGSAWTTVTANWTATAPYAGQAIQLQVVATNFLEGPGSSQQWQVPGFGFTHATLTATAPSTPPAAPSGLTATAASSSQINLNWTNNATDQGGFKIDQATSSDFSTGLITTTVGSNVTTYSAMGLLSGTTYYYRVRATNGAGDSANTATASAATLGAVPAAPSGLAATAISPSQINLSWTDNSSNETGFKIDQATSSDFSTGLTTVTVGAGITSYNATGLTGSTTYYYRVRATSAAGDSTNTAPASATTAANGTPVAIAVPDGDFTDIAGNYINSNTGGGLTFTSPMNATLSGWAIVAAPSTANGGLFSGWEPYGVLDSVTSGSGASPYNSNVAWIGNQPASSYHAFIYYPGEQYNNGGVVGGAQPGASFTMTSTGISAAAVAGTTYTATILYANVSWSNTAVNPSANVALNILANGVVVGTGTLAGLAQNSPWTPVTATWTATGAYAGQAIQLQVVATNFLEGPGSTQQWQVPTFGFTHATLTAAASGSIPAAPSGLTATAVSSSAVNLSWTDNSTDETGFEVDWATDASFTQNVHSSTVGVNITSYAVTGLSLNTRYYFRVRALGSGGGSAFSSAVQGMLRLGDANLDGLVDLTDLSILASNWQKTGRVFADGDFNGDGAVDLTDLSILASQWQTPAPAPAPVPAAPVAASAAVVADDAAQPVSAQTDLPVTAAVQINSSGDLDSATVPTTSNPLPPAAPAQPAVAQTTVRGSGPSGPVSAVLKTPAPAASAPAAVRIQPRHQPVPMSSREVTRNGAVFSRQLIVADTAVPSSAASGVPEILLDSRHKDILRKRMRGLKGLFAESHAPG